MPTAFDPTRDLVPGSAWLGAVCGALARAARFIRQERAGFRREMAEQKAANDLVSYVDREVERRLHAELLALTPGAAFLMEETGAHAATAGSALTWVVDPLDGTTNFVFGVPIFSISAALQQAGRTVLGAVLEVNAGELFLALSGHGTQYIPDVLEIDGQDVPALVPGRPLAGSRAATLAEGLAATGFPFRDFQQVDQYMAVLKAFMLSTRGLRRLGSAAVDLAYVAAGRFDVFFERNLYPWDVAAGALLVQEAGGVVTDFAGGPDFISRREILAAGSPGLHAEAMALLRAHVPQG